MQSQNKLAGFSRFYISLWKGALPIQWVYILPTATLSALLLNLFFFQPENKVRFSYLLWKMDGSFFRKEQIHHENLWIQVWNFILIWVWWITAIFTDSHNSFLHFCLHKSRTSDKLPQRIIENQHTPSEAYHYGSKNTPGKVIHSVSPLKDQ